PVMTEPVVPRPLSIIKKGGAGDERSLAVPLASRLIHRQDLGALAVTILVLLFFIIVAGNSGMFGSQGILNFLEVSAELGLFAVALSLPMIGVAVDTDVVS